MTKSNLIIGLLAILLIGNGILFFQLKRGSPHRDGGENPRELISSTLHFNEAQNKRYDVLIQQHRKQIRQADDSLRTLKEALYSEFASTDSARCDSFITAINLVQKNIEYIHWHHFKQIEALCTPEQTVYFAELQQSMARLFSKPPHPPRH